MLTPRSDKKVRSLFTTSACQAKAKLSAIRRTISFMFSVEAKVDRLIGIAYFFRPIVMSGRSRKFLSKSAVVSPSQKRE